MTIEDVIYALEVYTREINDKAMFILQKEVEPQSFKAYKKYLYTLWYIDRSRDKRFPITSVSLVSRVTSPEEEQEALKKVETQLMQYIFKLMRSETFNLILGGSYDGDEQVSDPIN